jgi:hypothetical protein
VERRRAVRSDRVHAPEAAHVEQRDNAVIRRIDPLERAIVALARLAAPDPQFNNPIEAWSAQSLRDRILESARGGKPLRGES